MPRVENEDYFKRCKLCKPHRYIKNRLFLQHVLKEHTSQNELRNSRNSTHTDNESVTECLPTKRLKQERNDCASKVEVKREDDGESEDDDEHLPIKIVSVADGTGNVIVKTEVEDFLPIGIQNIKAKSNQTPICVTLSSDSEFEDEPMEKSRKIANPLSLDHYHSIMNKTAVVVIEPLEESLKNYFRGKDCCAEKKIYSPKASPSSGFSCSAKLNDNPEPKPENETKVPTVVAGTMPQKQLSEVRPRISQSEYKVKSNQIISGSQGSSNKLHKVSQNVLPSHFQSSDGKSVGYLVGAWQIFPTGLEEGKSSDDDDSAMNAISNSHPAMQYIDGLKERDELDRQRIIKKENRYKNRKAIPQKTVETLEEPVVATKDRYEQTDLPKHIRLLDETVNGKQVFKCRFCDSQLFHEGQFSPHLGCQYDPRTRPMPRSKRYGDKTKSKKKYCICKNTFEGEWKKPMIQCTSCRKWYHGICAGLHKEFLDSVQLNQRWDCFRCKGAAEIEGNANISRKSNRVQQSGSM